MIRSSFGLESTKTEVPAEDTNAYFDENDQMQELLQKRCKYPRSASPKNEQKEGYEFLEDPKIRQIFQNWDTIIDGNKALKDDLRKGKMDERKLREAFSVNVDDAKLVELVDEYLVCKEKPQALLHPVMSSYEEMVDLFGDHSSIKPAAPGYWKQEVSKGRPERARLIKVGIDIPAVWRIQDALQEITADLYMTFTWKVKAKRDEIWNSVSRKFEAPVWKVRLRNGKFISNLKDYTFIDETISAGNELNGLTTIIQRITITGSFSQNFDLHRFPFDVQKVGFLIRYWLLPYLSAEGEKRGRLIFYEDIDWQCRVKDDALKPNDEWSIRRRSGYEYDKLKFTSELTDKKKDPKAGRRWPEINFFFIIERKPEFMKWNVALPITMIVIFGLVGNLTAFYSDFDRTSFTAALLFTIISIRSNVQYALSKVGYRTTLDGYILLSLAIVITQGVAGVAFSHVTSNDVRSGEPENFKMLSLPLFFGAAGLLFWIIITVRFWMGKTLFCYDAGDYKVPDYEETA